jgi:hypothetical protein
MKTLARQHNIEIPVLALSDRQAASSFIDSVKKQPRASESTTQNGVVQPATERQIAFATKLLTERGLGPLPIEATQSRAAMTAFIESLLNSKREQAQQGARPSLVEPGATMEPPTEKQVRTRATALAPVIASSNPHANKLPQRRRHRAGSLHAS